MKTTAVIARAYQGQPLHRVAIEESERLIYITIPERVPAVEAGDWYPTGFPKEDIFVYNSDTYEILRSQWEKCGRTDPNVWRTLSRYIEAD